MKRIILPILVVGLVAGCGSSKKPALYSRGATEPCVRKHPGVSISNRLDFVASTADGGAFHVHMPYNDATVSFSSTEDRASNVANAYRRFHAKNVGVEDILRTYKNVVILWRLHPRSDDEIVILNCLK